MGKISRYAKSKVKKVPVVPAAVQRGFRHQSAAKPPELPPPASEGEVPDAAPAAPPVQTASTPKMVTASTRTMRKPITD